MNGRAPATLVLLAGLLLMPTALAHGPPEPRDFETRLLTDQNDDCGGHTAGGCQGTHDLLALSVREAWTDEDVLVFSLWMDHGESGAKKDVISFKAGSKTQTIELTTSNDRSFSASKGDAGAPYALRGPDGSQDGERFGVDITVPRSALGLDAGDDISSFRVEAHVDGTLGDFMPGTSQTAIGPAPKGQTEQANPAETVRQRYTLRGPVQYLGLDADKDADVGIGSTTFVGLDLENLLGDRTQRITLTATDGDGVDVGFHVPDSGDDQYDPTMSFDLAAKASNFVHLALTGTKAASGTVTVTATTDLGGRVTDTVAYEVRADTATTAPDTSAPPTTTTDDSPFGLVALIGGLVVAAAWTRRT